MKAALALVFFACIAGSMAADARNEFVGQLVQQGQAIAQAVLGQLQSQVLQIVQQAVGQLSSLVASIGGRFDFDAVLGQLTTQLQGLANQLLGQVLGSLQGLIGGRAELNLSEIFSGFLQEVQGALTGIGQHFLNQGLAAVLGGLGSLGGSRFIGGLFDSISQQIGAAVTAAQGALTGALSNLQALGSSIIDASKPHWEQLQEQLVGHGLNALGSLSETINNFHGSIAGGR